MDEALKQLLTLGRGYFDKKQYAQAEQYLSQFVEQNQSFADVYNMLGIIYHDQGQFARAQRAFESALRINPGYTEAALNLAVIYNDMGKYAEAKEVYQTALSRQKNAPGEMDPFVKGKIANMYADIGNVFASNGAWEPGHRRVPAGAGAVSPLRGHPDQAGGCAEGCGPARRGPSAVRAGHRAEPGLHAGSHPLRNRALLGRSAGRGCEGVGGRARA